MRALIQANAGLLIAGIMTFVLMGAGQSIYGPALPAFEREFGLVAGQGRYLISALWIGSATGVAISFLRGKGMIPRHALGTMAVGSAIVAAGPGWWGTLAGSVIFGTGYGISTVVFNPRMLKTFADKGPSMLGLLNAMFGVGAIVAPLVFVALGSDPQISFGLIAGLCALIWLAAGAGENDAPDAQGSTQAYRIRPLILLFGTVCIGIEACLIGLGPSALIRSGMTEVEAAQLLSAFFVAFLLSRVALVLFAHLVPAFTIYTVSMAGAAASAIAALFLTPGPFFVIMGGFAGLFFPGFYVTATRAMGDHPRVAPTIIAAGLVGGISSPVILGALVGGMGERGFFWIIAGLTGATTAAAMLMMRRLNRD
ncbi:MAG: MFS transporter [Pseudomonadota bacterium]